MLSYIGREYKYAVGEICYLRVSTSTSLFLSSRKLKFPLIENTKKILMDARMHLLYLVYEDDTEVLELIAFRYMWIELSSF